MAFDYYAKTDEDNRPSVIFRVETGGGEATPIGDPESAGQQIYRWGKGWMPRPFLHLIFGDKDERDDDYASITEAEVNAEIERWNAEQAAKGATSS